MRAEFVDSVGEEVIKQLLDDLLQEGVLNKGEKNHILQKSSCCADQARCLIDTVMGKGDDASNTMLKHFEKRDRNLCTKLVRQLAVPDLK